jgi:hypothetical protein
MLTHVIRASVLCDNFSWRDIKRFDLARLLMIFRPNPNSMLKGVSFGGFSPKKNYKY